MARQTKQAEAVYHFIDHCKEAVTGAGAVTIGGVQLSAVHLLEAVFSESQQTIHIVLKDKREFDVPKDPDFYKKMMMVFGVLLHRLSAAIQCLMTDWEVALAPVGKGAVPAESTPTAKSVHLAEDEEEVLFVDE